MTTNNAINANQTLSTTASPNARRMDHCLHVELAKH